MEYFYTQTHEWFFIRDGIVFIGLTQYAIDQLTEVTYIMPICCTKHVTAGDTVADIESVKTVDAVYTPCNGRVKDCNFDVINVINQTPEESTSWIVAVTPEADFDTSTFMTKEQYLKFVEGL